jgi:hypothetical protein
MSDNDQEIYVRWRQATLTRIGSHGFRDRVRIDDRPACEVFLEAVFQLHFKNSRYNCIPSPLPTLPALPLHDRSLRIQLREKEPPPKPYLKVELNEYHWGYRWPLEVQDLLEANERYVVVALPGAGKSTLVAWAARYMIREASLASLIPLCVPLRACGDWLNGDTRASVYRFYWESMLKLPSKVSEEFESFMKDVEEGKGQLRNLVRPLLDGWDDVPVVGRKAIVDFVDRLENRLPAIVTTRPEGYTAELRNWKYLDVLPLNPSSMGEIIQDWFRAQRDWKGADLLYRHIDQDREVHELAAIPFMLTLLCAVASAPSQKQPSEKREYPSTRTKLCRSALDLVSKQFHYQFGTGSGGAPAFSVTEMEDVACGLLFDEKKLQLEFDPSKVKKLAGSGDERVVSVWRQARLATLAELLDERLAFVHRTVHEYLASQAIVRRVEAKQIEVGSIGLRPSCLGVVRFAFGSVDSTGGERLWGWLARQCKMPDRFGLVLIKAAYFLAEAGQRDGGVAKLGFSILPALFFFFLRSPQHEPYAEALLALDTRFAMESVGLLGNMPESKYERLRVLLAYALQQDVYTYQQDYPYRPIMYVRCSEERPSAANRDLYTIVHEFPRRPDKSRTPAEIIRDLESGPDAVTRFRLWQELRSTETRSAEVYLIAECDRCSAQDVPELFTVIKDLRPAVRRDVLLRNVDRFEVDLEILRRVLDALKGVSVDHGGVKLLRYLEPKWPAAVRLAAAGAVQHAKLDESDLRRLAEYVCLTEEDASVRCSVWWALAEARYPVMVRSLLREGFSRRGGREISSIWRYLAFSADQYQEAGDHNNCLTEIEELFLEELKSKSPDLFAIKLAAVFRDSERVRVALAALACDPTKSYYDHKCALESLSELKASVPEEGLLSRLRMEAKTRNRVGFLQLFATALAWNAPNRLVMERIPAAHIALWEMSLKTGRLVYEDRIVDPETGKTTACLPPTVAASGSSGRAGGEGGDGSAKRVVGHRGRRYVWDTGHYLKLLDWFRNREEWTSEQACKNADLLAQAWGQCQDRTDAPRRGYMFAAVIALLLGEAFPLEKATFGYTVERINKMKACVEEAEEERVKAKKYKKIEKAPSTRTIFKIGYAEILNHKELVKIFRLTCSQRDNEQDRSKEAMAMRGSYLRALARIDAGKRSSGLADHDDRAQ